MAYSLNDIIEVKLVCRMGSEGSVNVRHYKYGTLAGSPTTEADVASDFFGLLSAAYAPCIAPVAQVQYVSTRRVNPPPVTASALSTQLPVVGTATGDALPRQTCGMISVFTAIPGPTGRGRNYIPFPTEAFNDANGQPTAAYQTLLAAIRDIWGFTQSLGAAGAHGVYVPFLWRPTTAVYTPIISASTRPYWGTQRRRNNNRF